MTPETEAPSVTAMETGVGFVIAGIMQIPGRATKQSFARSGPASHATFSGWGYSDSERPMTNDAPYLPRGSTWLQCLSAALVLAVASYSPCGHAAKSNPNKNSQRAQLSIGYSLLYQEADGIPKLNWLLTFKDKSEEMGRLTNDLVSYYQKLADTMQKLSKQYPAMRIDVPPMSKIESDERKAIGADQAKDFAPLAGKSGVDFEREALLMFYNALDEQRHLTGVMAGLETAPALKQFLETTKAELETRYAKVGALLSRRYFTH